MAYFTVVCFSVLGAVSLLAAVTGYRGQACDRHRGYEVPERVRADAALRKRANETVAFWCTGAAVLSVPPLVPSAGAILRGDGGSSWSLGALAALAAYGFLVVVLSRYPFEKIKHM
ncbi:hypothetical protein [Streptomyces sp. ODS28]|uniref:hypothetical protein n=1 Tax=Streptomyces sp. ODS28 TaxID=3136688 RepID=UPI0031E62B23